MHYLTHRRGAALVLVMIIGVGLAAMCAIASERMSGMKKIVALDLAKQKAAAAAEAVAAMVESRLMDSAADYTKLTIPVETGAALANHPWWGLKGCVYRDASGTTHGPGFDQDHAPIWFNGCLVRWSVEPSRVYNTAWTGTPSGSSQYVVNPPRDPSQITTWQTEAQTGPDGSSVPGSLNTAVGDFYHYRVVAQAYALKEPNNDTANPWASASSYVAAAQSLRILQIQSLQLFKYALFYAADEPIGDLDLQTGGTISVKKGAVHSNGAIYIRGGESTGFRNKNWHQMASGDGSVDQEIAGQSINLGEASYPVTVTGVAGIYRMGKTANCLAALSQLRYSDNNAQATLFDVRRPTDVPLDRSKFLSDNVTSGRSGANPLDLNGDLANSKRHSINGVPFSRANDSRSPLAMVQAFGNAARDSNNGASKVRTLQNIAELGGRPFEPQSVVFTVTGAKNRLYGSTGTNPLSVVSRNPTNAAGTHLVPLYYAANPTAGGASLPRPARGYRQAVAVVTAGGARSVTAEEIPLWWDANFTNKDVTNPSQEKALSDQIPAHAVAATAANAGDGSAYTLLTNASDCERPAWVNAAGVLQPGGTAADGLISFPGVPLKVPAWNPQFYGCGFSPREVKGYYLEAALFGDLAVSGNRSKQQQYYADAAGGVLQDISKTGIVIRERRWQQRPRKYGLNGAGFARPAPNAGHTQALEENRTAWNRYWPGDGWLTGATAYPNPRDNTNPIDVTNTASVILGATSVVSIPRPTLNATPTATEKLNYVQYLCSQYTVLFCGRNITAPFFGQILSQADPRDFIVTEDEFVDQRESGYMWGMYGATGNVNGLGGPTNDFYQYNFFTGLQNSTIPGAGATASRDYRQNVITVHMRAFQEWLRNTPMTDLGYTTADKAKDHFTGVLYCSRARRGETYHPLFAPELDWPGMADRIVNNVQSDPTRLVNQNHYRAYWYTDVTNTGVTAITPDNTINASTTPILYPPVNFPWNWREPSGAFETSRCATRIKGQTNDVAEADSTYYRVYWNHTTTTSTSDALGTSGFTFITPQRFYMWGNFAYVVSPLGNEPAGIANINSNLSTITPCAVFADNYTMQSVAWRDVNAQKLPTGWRGTPFDAAGNEVRGASTCQFISMVINNSPNDLWNSGSFGSAGQEGTFRMMENWGGDLWWSGSQVVMNMGRYHHSGHNYVEYNRTDGRQKAPAHMGIRAFDTCSNHYIFNTNLFSRQGRPPLSPSGTSATRVINQLTFFGD